MYNNIHAGFDGKEIKRYSTEEKTKLVYNKEESKVKLVITLPGQRTETWYSLPKEDNISIARAVQGLRLRIKNIIIISEKQYFII